MTTTPETQTGTLSEEEGNDLFHKAFSELTEEAPVQEPATPVEKEKPAVETPAKAEEVVTDTTTTTPPPAQPTQPATIEQLIEQFPEDKRSLVQQLITERNLAEQKFKSHQGRLAQERKQRLQMERELVTLRSGGASSTQEALAAQAKVDHTKAIDEWKQVVEAEPTLAKAIDALTDAKVGDVEKRLRGEYERGEEFRQRESHEEEKQREWNLVIEAVPNTVDVISSPEFRHWKENIAPPGVRNLIENSIDHRDALFVLEQFAPYAMWVHNQKNGTQSSQASPAPTTTVADKISEQRENKASPVVNGGIVTPNTTPALGDTFDDDVAARLFAEAYKKIKSR